MEELLAEGKSVDLHHDCRALAVDIVCDYSFDNFYNQLDTPGFAADSFDTTGALIPRSWYCKPSKLGTDFESCYARDSEEDEHGTLSLPTVQNGNAIYPTLNTKVMNC